MASATDGDFEMVKNLAEDPSVNVNWVNEDEMKKDTSLHRACRFGHVEIVKVLLAHEEIEVNKGNFGQATPFRIACQECHLLVISLLLLDPRVDPNHPDIEGVTSFYLRLLSRPATSGLSAVG